MKIQISLCFLIVLSLTTCRKDIYGPDACFNENVLPVFVTNCTMSGCHNAKDRKAHLDLSSYEGILEGVKPYHPLLSDVYKVIKGKNPSMPEKPYPKLSNREVSIIKLWIDMGAQNTSNCSSCDTVNYGYSNRVAKLINSWCLNCHNSSSAGGGIDLSDYNGVAKAVVSGRFLGSIKQEAGYVPMPQGAGKIAQCDIAAIEKWIKSGYPDN